METNLTKPTGPRMKRFMFSTPVRLPMESIDLYHWLINISEADYQNFSRGHRAIGLCKRGDANGMVNVESIGGNLLVQHYTFQEVTKQKVTLISERSDLYMYHVLKLHVGVEWTMSLSPVGQASCLFACEIGLRYPNSLLPVAARFTGGNYFLQKHLTEEGQNFANDIERRFS